MNVSICLFIIIIIIIIIVIVFLIISILIIKQAKFHINMLLFNIQSQTFSVNFLNLKIHNSENYLIP